MKRVWKIIIAVSVFLLIVVGAFLLQEKPNLKIISAELLEVPKVGDPYIYFNLTYQNTGSAKAKFPGGSRLIKLTIQEEDGSSSLLGQISVFYLGSKEKYIIEPYEVESHIFTSLQDHETLKIEGSKQVTIELDPDNKIKEVDEGDNTITKEINVLSIE